MQNDSLFWLVPVVAGIIVLYVLFEMYKFYRPLRMWPWQVRADKRRKLANNDAFDLLIKSHPDQRKAYTAFGAAIADEIAQDLTGHSFADCVDAVETAYQVYDQAQKTRYTRMVDRWSTWIVRGIWIAVILLIAIRVITALSSCGISRYPYGKSYYQNNPTCTSRRP